MNKLSLEHIIKSKAQEYEVSMPQNAWNDFSGKLPGMNATGTAGAGLFGSVMAKSVLIASLFVIPALGIYFLMDIGNAEREKLMNKEIVAPVNEKAPVDLIEEVTIEKDKSNTNASVNESEEEAVEQRIYVFNPINKGTEVYFGPSEANKENITRFRMLIRDAEGKIIFESNNKYLLWDGKIQKTKEYARDGMYDWFIVIIDSEGDVYRKRGKVRLDKSK